LKTKHTALAVAGVLISVACATGGQAALASSPRGVAGPAPSQPGACCNATGANEPKVGGDYGDQDYSSLTQITPGNVPRLAGAWEDKFSGDSTKTSQEGTPVALNGDLYLQTAQGVVTAVGGATGKVVWTYNSGYPHVERGVAVGDGRVFAAFGLEHVVALNQATGRLIWETRVGTPGQDTEAEHAQTEYVLYYDGLILVGTNNGGVSGGRGHLYALSAATGAVVWSFGDTAAPGQPGASSWVGDEWLTGGGDSWIPPAIDPTLGLVYLAVGNPEPRIVGGERPGDNLYANSLVAINVKTGRLVWYFQSVHHDIWDYDNTMYPVIADVRYGRTVREVVIYGSKTARLFYLNARTGKPVLAVHEVAVPQLAAQATSPTQPIPAGDSLIPTCPQASGNTEAIPDYIKGCEFTPFGDSAVMITPGFGGGADWAPMSFDRQTGLLYVAASEADTAYSSGEPYGQPTTWAPLGERRGGILDAVNPQTNKIAWQVATEFPLSKGDGPMTTAGGLLFQGSPSGVLSARSPVTGRSLWRWQTGTGITTTPITYEVRGTQYVAVLAGTSSSVARLWAFRLGGTLRQASAPGAEPTRMPIDAPAVAGAKVKYVVVLGRVWDAATGRPGSTENLASETAMSPEIMQVPAGTTVRFENPQTNEKYHCAESFFDPAGFKIGPLAPGQSGTYRFVKPGDYYYNDCAGFPWNTGEIIVG
jgi:PQQ-dependent dehydrogenase (methanol/ethanol family)